MRYALVTVLLLASATTQRAKQRGLQTPLRVRPGCVKEISTRQPTDVCSPDERSARWL